MEMFPLVDVDVKAFTVPTMKREHELRGLGVGKSTQRPSAARWTEKVRRGEDPRAKKDRPKPAAAEGAAGAEDDSDLERDEYVKGGLTCHDYVRLAHCYNDPAVASRIADEMLGPANRGNAEEMHKKHVAKSAMDDVIPELFNSDKRYGHPDPTNSYVRHLDPNQATRPRCPEKLKAGKGQIFTDVTKIEANVNVSGKNARNPDAVTQAMGGDQEAQDGDFSLEALEKFAEHPELKLAGPVVAYITHLCAESRTLDFVVRRFEQGFETGDNQESENQKTPGKRATAGAATPNSQKKKQKKSDSDGTAVHKTKYAEAKAMTAASTARSQLLVEINQTETRLSTMKERLEDAFDMPEDKRKKLERDIARMESVVENLSEKYFSQVE
jgi:hypothetical protein